MELRTVLLAVVLALTAACSSKTDAAETGSQVTTAAAAPAPSRAPTSTSTGSTTTSTSTTTTTVAASDSSDEVGSQEALLAAIEVAIRETEDFYDYDPADVPIPDLTNPDPTVALREMLLFEAWVLANGPDSHWAAVYAYPGSPAEADLLRGLDATFMVLWRFADLPGIQIHSVSELALTDVSIPQPALDLAPEGSRFLRYEYSVSPYIQYDIELDETIREFSGTTDANLAVISPSGSGWLKFFSEPMR